MSCLCLCSEGEGCSVEQFGVRLVRTRPRWFRAEAEAGEMGRGGEGGRKSKSKKIRESRLNSGMEIDGGKRWVCGNIDVNKDRWMDRYKDRDGEVKSAQLTSITEF